MSDREHIAPTRVNLLRSRKQLAQVEKGAELVRRKREALVGELFKLARPAMGARAGIAKQAANAYPALLETLAAHGSLGTRAFAWPSRSVRLTVRPALVWGIPVAEIVERGPVKRTHEARGITGGSGTVVEAAEEFETLVDLLISAAAREQQIQRLGDAVARSTRQLRTLEQRIEPALRSRISWVRGTLDEREREEHVRLKRLRGRQELANSR
jgi:V/A-type H+-transporting ATPase subunit D